MRLSRMSFALMLAVGLCAPKCFAQCSLFPLGGYVGIFAEPEALNPVIFFDAVPSLRTLYIVAILDGATTNGFTGVQFRIEVARPEGWFFDEDFPDAAFALGNPFDFEPENPSNPAGVGVAWTQCRVGIPPVAGTPVLIGTISALNAFGESTDLLIKRDLPSPSPGAPCARFALCDPPLFSRAPMPAREVDAFGEEIVFRSSLIIDIPIPVTPATWGGVKNLYQ